MNDETPVAIVRTREERRRRFPLIWIIPVLTVLIAGWLAWDTLSKRGPEITIRFENASGLQAGQSHIRNRDVDLGLVRKIVLSPDRKSVLVTAQMTREAVSLLTDKTRFWVVKPRFFAGSISGLETLVSGGYIQLEPSEEGGASRTEFIGLEDPPLLRSSARGRTFRLKSARVGSLNPGSQILFRDLTVGEILGWDVGEMAKEVTIYAFVREPFDKYVHENTVFWNSSGASVQLGGNGLRVELDSLRALVLGGVAFDTPDRFGDAPVVAENHEFVLYRTHDAAEAASFGRSLRFVSYFKGSVGGLSAGSSVTLQGLRIGAVTEVALRYEQRLDAITAVVRFEVEPERIARLNLPGGDDLDKSLGDAVRRGLRVKLESSSLITGSKQLVMELVPKAAPAELEKQDDLYVIPALDGDSGDITASAGALMARLGAIPFEQIADNLNKTLAGASGTINDPKLRQAVGSLADTLGAVNNLVTSVSKGADPLLKRLPQIASELEGAIKHLNQLTGSLEGGYGGGSQFNRDTARLLSQVTDAARSVRILADLLSRHPEALIRGRTEREVR